MVQPIITDKTVEVELLRRYFGYKILGGHKLYVIALKF